MVGSAMLVLVGLWIAGAVPVPWSMDGFWFRGLFGDYVDFGYRHGIPAAIASWRPYLGWGLVAAGFMQQWRLVLWPFKNAYWLRRFFGERIYGGARWARRTDLHKAGMTTPGGLFLAHARGVDLYHGDEGHLMTIGGTGGGKSAGLVVPTLCTLTQGSVIVTDPSGELAAMTARRRAEIGPVIFLNPFAQTFEKDTGLQFPDTGFNLFSILNPADTNFISDTAKLAQLLMVGDRRESGSYWNDEGAEFLALMIAAIRLYEADDLHNLSFLYRVVRDSSDGILHRLDDIMAQGHPALQDDARRFADIIANAPQQWTGIVSKAALATKRYAPDTPLGAHVSRNGFDASRLKTENITVYLLVPSSMLPVALPWLNSLIGVFGVVIGRPPAGMVTMMIDEAPSLGYLPDLRAHMAQYRKAGLRVWLFSQTYAAMASPELYGPAGMKEIMGLATVKQFFAVEEPEVQDMVSKMAGQRSVSNPSSTGATGDTGQPLIRPDEVRGLRRWHQIIFRGGLQYPVKAKLVPYFSHARWRAMVDPNPYRKGKS